jgi:RPA family protein
MAELRRTAHKVRIGDLLAGSFVKKEGWEPSYVIGEGGTEISRVNIIALAVSLNPSVPSLVLDDGSGAIETRSFDAKINLPDIEVGDVVQVIGKPRKYQEEMFVVPEIIKKVDPGWARVRASELAGKNVIGKPAAAQEAITEEVKESAPQRVYSLIKTLDKGEGADLGDLLKEIPDAERIVRTLLLEGDIFEVKSGRLKVLE